MTTDELQYISRTHRHLHDERRRFEVRYLLGAVAVYLLAPYVIIQGNPPSNPIALKIVIGVGFFLFATVTAGYLRFLHSRNAINKQIAEAAEQDIIQGSPGNNLQKLMESGFRRADYTSWIWQVGAIVVIGLLGASAVVATV